MRKLLFALLLAACGSSKPAQTSPAPPVTGGDPPQVTEPVQPAVAARMPIAEPMIVPTPGNPPAPAKGGAPEIGTWGFDIKGMNTKVSPGASFYNYASGTWLS